MFELQTVNNLANPDNSSNNKGKHYTFIKARLNDSFTQASLQRVQALGNARLRREPWFDGTNQLLKDANIEAWKTQNALDQMLLSLKDVYSFAEPLLKTAIRIQYGLDLNVRETCLHLYIPKEQPWYVIDTSHGVTTRTVSLLDAALHNFARTEHFEADSEFITRPDQYGRFEITPLKQKMTIKQFQTLCRELDIGGRYKRHLEHYLLPASPVAAGALQHWVSLSQKAALKAAAHLALKKKDISANAHSLILGLIHGLTNLTLDGKVMQA
ncbi:hypothetical protein Q9L58_010912, partial [Maublancomyces gigas]